MNVYIRHYVVAASMALLLGGCGTASCVQRGFAGFDCSGLIGHVYRSRAGVTPPWTVASLKSWGWQVHSDSIRSVDLVLFARNSVVSHAGTHVGNGRSVHAPSTGGAVRLDNLNSSYWAAQQFAFRRP